MNRKIYEIEWLQIGYDNHVENTSLEKLGTLPVLIYIFLFRPFCPSRVFAIIQQKSFSKIREVSLYFC